MHLILALIIVLVLCWAFITLVEKFVPDAAIVARVLAVVFVVYWIVQHFDELTSLSR